MGGELETTTLHQNETHLFHPNEHQNDTTQLKVKKQIIHLKIF